MDRDKEECIWEDRKD